MDMDNLDTTSEAKGFTVSVIICTRNRTQSLKECIDSILKQSCLPDDIIVVDSSDDGATKQLVDEYNSRASTVVKYVHTSPGLTRQRNIGVSESDNEIVAFLDDDVILDPNYLSEVINCFAVSKDVAGVSGKILNVSPISRISKYFRRFFLLTESRGARGYMKRSGFASFQMGYKLTKIEETEVLSGCCMSFRRDLFREYNFDECFLGYSYMEDVEFSYKVSRNHRLLVTPLAKLIHNCAPTGRQSLNELKTMQIYNHYYVFTKNVRKKPFDWFYFWWSEFGISIRSVAMSIRTRSVAPLGGLLRGYKKILYDIMRSSSIPTQDLTFHDSKKTY